MTSTAFEKTMKGLHYDEITTKWIRLPNIARINLTTNTSLYREETDDILAYYHFDKTRNLLFKAVTLPDASVIGVTLILDVSEITSVETRNAMSASMFAGNTY